VFICGRILFDEDHQRLSSKLSFRK
jgi:hypothetical protein